MKTYFIAVLALLIILGFMACGDDDSATTHTPKMYVVGYVYSPSVPWVNVAALWVDGALTRLYTNDNYHSHARAVAVDGSGIYIGGDDYSYIAEPWPFNALSWENGTQSVHAKISNNAYVYGVAIGANGRYYAGVVQHASGKEHACYWHNGVRTDLNVGLRSYATSIFVNSSDVYVAGYVNTNSKDVACYWINGVYHALPQPGGSNTKATGIYVDGAGVHISGELLNNKGALYWKNGAVTTLTTNGRGNATGIVTSGSDVYVVGNWFSNSTYYPAYWKNGQLVALTYNDSSAATGIAVYSTNVYISGNIRVNSTNTACYWKNGQQHLLHNSSGESDALALFLY